MTDAEIVRFLIDQGVTLVTAESCTGGLIAHRITEVAGSSAAFWGSFVTYDNEAKVLLGVSRATIERCGAVSPEVATEMARAALTKVAQAQNTKKGNVFCVSTTGVAGPGGGTPAKPVGLCQIAVAWGQNEVRTTAVHAPHDKGEIVMNRSEIKRFFADQALLCLVEAMQGSHSRGSHARGSDE